MSWTGVVAIRGRGGRWISFTSGTDSDGNGGINAQKSVGLGTGDRPEDIRIGGVCSEALVNAPWHIILHVNNTVQLVWSLTTALVGTWAISILAALSTPSTICPVGEVTSKGSHCGGPETLEGNINLSSVRMVVLPRWGVEFSGDALARWCSSHSKVARWGSWGIMLWCADSVIVTAAVSRLSTALSSFHGADSASGIVLRGSQEIALAVNNVQGDIGGSVSGWSGLKVSQEFGFHGWGSTDSGKEKKGELLNLKYFLLKLILLY